MSTKKSFDKTFKPTVSVYLGGQLVDLGFYYNRRHKDLLYEAMALLALFHDCKTLKEFNRRRFGTASGTVFPVTDIRADGWEAVLRFLAGSSDFPLIVDLTANCIYVSEQPLTAEELLALPSATDAQSLPKEVTFVYKSSNKFDAILSRCKVSFTDDELRQLLPTLRRWRGAKQHLSAETFSLLHAKPSRSAKRGAVQAA